MRLKTQTCQGLAEWQDYVNHADDNHDSPQDSDCGTFALGRPQFEDRNLRLGPRLSISQSQLHLSSSALPQLRPETEAEIPSASTLCTIRFCPLLSELVCGDNWELSPFPT